MLARFAFAAALLVPVAAGATDFQTVDKIGRNNVGSITITGLPVGSTTAVTVGVNNGDMGNACEKYALIMMTHHGRYILSVVNPLNCSITPQTP